MNILTLISNLAFFFLLFFSQSDFRFSCFSDRSGGKKVFFFSFRFKDFSDNGQRVSRAGKKKVTPCDRIDPMPISGGWEFQTTQSVVQDERCRASGPQQVTRYIFL